MAVARQWLDSDSYQIVAVSVSDRLVIVSVEGTGELPPLQDWGSALSTALNRLVVVKVRVIPSQTAGSAFSPEGSGLSWGEWENPGEG